LAKKYDGHTYNADANYDQALHDQAENLTTSNTHTPAAAGPATPSSPSNKPHVAPGDEALPSGQNQF
jgi:heme-binding NEAT domain protein